MILRHGERQAKRMFEIVSKAINWSIIAAFIVCFSYQAVYFFVRYRKKPQIAETGRKNRYAVLIAARNEERVIGDLIDSIHGQTYPGYLLDIFVVADNCTDRTAEVVRCKGAECYERVNREKVGKGYALEFLLNQLMKDGVLEDYEGYFIFDADNILQRDYVEEMNRVFNSGYEVVTSYRNSKNFGENWISFGYGLWFLHEAEFLNKGRMAYGNSCMVSGTGYLISTKVLLKNNGWKFFLLTEDIEFSADCILNDIKIGYCGNAEFFDEQPTRLKDSWNQRLRWVKGYYQVFGKYGRRLASKTAREHSFSAYDMMMGYLPAFLLTSVASLIGLAMLVIGIVAAQNWMFTLQSVGVFLISTFAAMFVLGIYTEVTQWKKIPCSNQKKIAYLFTFPIFMYTYFPIAIAAISRKVEWKPIQHGLKREPQVQLAGGGAMMRGIPQGIK